MMKRICQQQLTHFLLLLLLSIGLFSCESAEETTVEMGPTAMEIRQDSLNFITAITMHLDAVKNKDFEALKRTVPTKGDMHLILPNGTIVTKVEDFLDMHEEWFQDTTWTMESEILYTNNSPDFGIALVESTNREPERNGKPYFHKMAISYSLKKINNNWLVIFDHASTIEKSE